MESTQQNSRDMETSPEDMNTKGQNEINDFILNRQSPEEVATAGSLAMVSTLSDQEEATMQAIGLAAANEQAISHLSQLYSMIKQDIQSIKSHIQMPDSQQQTSNEDAPAVGNVSPTQPIQQAQPQTGQMGDDLAQAIAQRLNPQQ